MRLVVVSHTPHYMRAGELVGWGPTVRELDHLATLFDEVVHVAPLHEGAAPGSALPYRDSRITLNAVRASGGARLAHKLSALFTAPQYVRVAWLAMRRADVVHVRCPSGISLLAVILLALIKKPRVRWVKYAGNWQPEGEESWSYRFQRWWLRKGLAGGVVTVNGDWPGHPSFIRPFFNPSLTSPEIEEGRAAAAQKTISGDIRLLFVGRLEEEKGAVRALEVLARLRRKGHRVTLDLVGDGPERPQIKAEAARMGVTPHVTFRGWLTRQELNPVYAKANLMVLPTSCSEGWPKVLSEAMAFGVVPVAGGVSSIPQYFEKFRAGVAVDPHDVEGFVAAVETYAARPLLWEEAARNGVRAAEYFTYDYYLSAVESILKSQTTGGELTRGRNTATTTSA